MPENNQIKKGKSRRVCPVNPIRHGDESEYKRNKQYIMKCDDVTSVSVEGRL
jgi:hypothetical protein